jgi:hypothetical protein
MHPYEYVITTPHWAGWMVSLTIWIGLSWNILKEATEFLNKTAPEGSTIFVYAPVHLVEAIRVQI